MWCPESQVQKVFGGAGGGGPGSDQLYVRAYMCHIYADVQTYTYGSMVVYSVNRPVPQFSWEECSTAKGSVYSII